MRRMTFSKFRAVRQSIFLALLSIASAALSEPTNGTNIFATASTPAKSVAHLSIFVLVITGIIFAVVFTLLVYAALGSAGERQMLAASPLRSTGAHRSYPKMTGRMLSERLGKWHFWLFLIGFHVAFDLMHIPGLLGMPRRIYTYEPSRGWDTLNLLITIGSFVQAIAILVFVANLVISYFKGDKASNDPWDAWTLDRRNIVDSAVTLA